MNADSVNYLKGIREPLRPRIRMTSFCNRQCNYCFAQDFLSEETSDREISIDNLTYILNRLTEDGIPMVGWQGGEPLLHSRIDEVIALHKQYGIQVMLFTNALVPPDVIQSLDGVVEHVLINCNEPSTYSAEEWTLFNQNIASFISLKGTGKVALGINVYDSSMDTDFIIDLSVKHGIKEVRIDMTRPAPSNTNDFIKFSGINQIFALIKQTIMKLERKGISTPHLDCPFPLCTLSEEDKRFVQKYIHDDLKFGACRTGVDITTNAKLSSCFCSVPIRDTGLRKYKNIWHAWLSLEHLENKIRWERYTKESCKTCSYHTQQICQGGCLGYKIDAGEHVDFAGIKYSQNDLPDHYLEELASAYKFFYKSNYVDCYLVLKRLLTQYEHERALWLMAVVCVYLKYDAYVYFVKFITVSKTPLISAYEAGSVLWSAKLLDLSQNVMDYGLDLATAMDSGYQRLLHALIKVVKESNKYDEINKYFRMLITESKEKVV
ncbi:radical SAM protein [Paenibacillus camerounensis]|uniref:radical SAM protein n=1 Tax=Paenibacillus camerounensis TaxID=1243663 RepID=UPI0005A6AF72